MIACYGPGDAVTWGPVTSPADPRAPEPADYLEATVADPGWQSIEISRLLDGSDESVTIQQGGDSIMVSPAALGSLIEALRSMQA